MSCPAGSHHMCALASAQEGGFQHLHIPTVDYLYAPPLEDLHRGVAFIAGARMLA